MAAGLTIARARGVEPALQSEPGAGMTSAASDADVSVVICACSDERFEMLRQAIASVQRQATHAREVIVVIDHNPELLARARATFPSLQVLANSERSGLPGARNTGARVAQSDLVAFLDDDAVAAPDWIGSLHEILMHAGVLGGGGQVTPRWPGDARPLWLPEEFLWVVGCSYRGLPEKLAVVRNPIGANMAIKRTVLQELGGFRLDMGPVEETEFCVRATQRWPGRAWLLSPQPRVEHVVSPERCHIGYFVWRCYWEGLAKARLRTYVGRQDALASERIYVRRILPAAVARGLADAARGDRWGAVRAGVVLTGVCSAAAGYARGRFESIAGPRFARQRRYTYRQAKVRPRHEP